MPFSPPEVVPFSPHDFAVALNEWFQSAKREMPWRRDENHSDPYRILVSEMMLQQTTVAAVVPFFERFIVRFPTVSDLAKAPEADVLAFWAGLGYYSRARNLQRAAKVVMERHGGQFPTDFASILALPGVGRYTAGAVASIALEQRQPIVDANVARVLSRVLCIDGDLKSAQNQAKLWEGATKIVAVEAVSPREINPALMELGALVCTPKNPKCDACPVSKWCAARAKSRQNELPFSAPKAALTPLFDVCAFAQNERGEVLLRRRPSDAKWWQNMWELPRTTRIGAETAAQALHRLGKELGFQIEAGEEVSSLKHGVTRYSIALSCFQSRVSAVESEELRYFSFSEALALPLPSTMTTLLKRLEKPRVKQLSLL